MSQETVNEQAQGESVEDFGNREPEEMRQPPKDLPDFPEEAWNLTGCQRLERTLQN